MTPLRAQIVAARAYEAAWTTQVVRIVALADEPVRNAVLAQASSFVAAHRRAAEIMEAEAAKEEDCLEHCDRCDDSGYVETFSGGIWTGENISSSRSICNCACGDDVRREMAARAKEEGGEG